MFRQTAYCGNVPKKLVCTPTLSLKDEEGRIRRRRKEKKNKKEKKKKKKEEEGVKA